MATDDTTNFWKSWRSIYNKNCSQFPPVVAGFSDKKAIAEAFCIAFSLILNPTTKARSTISTKNFLFDTKHLKTLTRVIANVQWNQLLRQSAHQKVGNVVMMIK